MPVDGSDYRLVLTTCPDAAVALAIAEALVAERAAACVNVVSGVTSVYRWEDGVQQDSEQLLVIKTCAAAVAAVERRIRALHPYELPEIVAVPLDTGAKDYLAWISESVTAV